MILAALTSALLLTGEEGRAQGDLSRCCHAGMLEERYTCAMKRIHNSGGTGVVVDVIDNCCSKQPLA